MVSLSPYVSGARHLPRLSGAELRGEHRKLRVLKENDDI